MKKPFSETRVNEKTSLSVTELSDEGLSLTAITLREISNETKVTASSMLLKKETAIMLKDILSNWNP